MTLRVRFSAALILGAYALVTAVGIGAVHARDRPAALFSYCGFGNGPADSLVQPGGGGDVVIIREPQNIYHFIFDSSSPTTPEAHDRIFIEGIDPGHLSIQRVDDHLVVCDASRNYQLVIERQYCRTKEVTEQDVPNNEIEELIFVSTGEIWITDSLYEALEEPTKYPLASGFDAEYGERLSWKVHKFSQVLPNWSGATTTCSAP